MRILSKKKKSTKEQLEEALIKLEKLNQKHQKTVKKCEKKIDKVNEDYLKRLEERSQRQLEEMMRGNQELSDYLDDAIQNRILK